MLCYRSKPLRQFFRRVTMKLIIIIKCRAIGVSSQGSHLARLPLTRAMCSCLDYTMRPTLFRCFHQMCELSLRLFLLIIWSKTLVYLRLISHISLWFLSASGRTATMVFYLLIHGILCIFLRKPHFRCQWMFPSLCSYCSNKNRFQTSVLSP